MTTEQTGAQARPRVTRRQAAQRRLSPQSENLLTDDFERADLVKSGGSELLSARRAASQAKYAESLRSRFGPDWIFDHPLINPARIIEEAADRPMSAALVCHQACVLLNVGHHKRVREYLVAAYSVACGFKANRGQIKDLAYELRDGRSSSPIKVEKVECHLLHYVFIYIFYQSGMVTRDRATQYVKSLQYFFDRDITHDEIAKLLTQHGQNKLRKAALRRDSIMQAAHEWVQQGKDPSSVTMEEVLDAMAAEDSKSQPPDAGDGPGDHSPRDISPGDLKYRVEVESLSDEADWLDENDPERNPNAIGYEEDDELESDDSEEEEDVQPPEVEEFFGDMMRLTAQMIVGLSDNRLDARHREAMMALVQELWTKVMLFRGPLA